MAVIDMISNESIIFVKRVTNNTHHAKKTVSQAHRFTIMPE